MATSYDAFISYSHAADGKLAPALQNALQRFAKPWYRLRALHLFRDQTSLSASPGLWPSIEQALLSSRYFLLLASPEAAQSRWVQQEVDWWLEHKSPQTLLIALTDGRIVRHPGAKDFDWTETGTTALPPNLEGVFTENPLWVDFRWAKGQEHLSTKNPEFQNALAALAAPLRNIPKEDLIGEDVRQHRRALLLARTAALVLVVLLILAGWQWREAENQRNVAVAERDRAEEQATIAQVRQLTAQSQSLAGDQLDLALLLGLEANRISDTPATRGVIATALSSSPHLARYLRGDPEAGRSVAFNPDGSLIAVAREGGVDIWNVVSGDRLQPGLTGHDGAVHTVAFSPADANLLASAGDDGTVRLWDVARHQPSGEPLVGHSDMITSIAFSPDGTTLVSGSEDATVIVWDVAARQRVGEPLAADEAVTSLAFAPDGKTFAVGGGQDSIIIWNVNTRRQVRVLTSEVLPTEISAIAALTTEVPDTEESFMAVSLAFSPTDTTLLASGGPDGKVRLWNITTGEEQGTRLSGHTGVVSSLAFSPDGATLASASQDGTVRLWDVRTRQAIAEPLNGHGRIVGGLAFRPGGGSPALASSGEDGRVILWDLEVQHRLSSPGPDQAFMGVALPVLDLAFGPDETTLASTAWGINLWDVTTRERIRTVAPNFNNVPITLAFSPRDRGMLGVGSQDGTVAVWDSTTGTAHTSPLAGHSESVLGVGFSPDGAMLASAGEDGTVRLWDTVKGEAFGSPITGYADEVSTVDFSPVDANLLAFGGTEGTLVLWDIGAGRPRVEPLVGHEGRVHSVVFSPDGNLLASGSADGTVRLWNPATGEVQGELPIALSSSVLSVTFSADGQLLAAGDAGGSIHLWDVATRQPLGLPLAGHEASAYSLAFRPDGRTLASGDLGGQVTMWDIDLNSWRALACGLAGRNLTAEEWRQYLGGEPYQETCPQGVDRAETIVGATPEVVGSATTEAATDAIAVNPRATPLDPAPDEVMQRVYGPVSGTLEPQENQFAFQSAEVYVRNFVVETRFFNPSDPAGEGWDYGFVFRGSSYWILVDSDGVWTFSMLTDGREPQPLTGGVEPDLDVSPGGSNVLRLVVEDDEALFFINGRYVATLDVSAQQVESDVAVITAVMPEHARQGQSTRYEDWTIQAILAPAEATAAAQVTATATVRLSGRSIPDPAECDVTPRSLASVTRFARPPGQIEASPAASVPFTLPPGQPASEEVVMAITATERTIIACLNAGDWLRYLALYSDGGLRHYNAILPITDEVLSIFARPPVPRAEPDRMALVAILDVRVLADGRIGSLIELDDPSYLPERREVQFFTFVEEGGRYLVDDFVGDLEDQFSAADGPPGPPSDSSASTPAISASPSLQTGA